VDLPPEYHELSLNLCQAQCRGAPRTQLQLEEKEIQSSIDSSRASLKIREELVRGGNIGCQGFLCSGSPSGGTKLELFYTAVPLNKLIWHMLCWRLCFGKPQVEPEG